jgi:hypothetical protein
MSGEQDFESFCADFGYDTDSRKAEKIWNACRASNRKAKRIIDGDLYTLANALNERLNPTPKEFPSNEVLEA